MNSFSVQEHLQHAASKTRLRLTSASSWALPKQESSIAPDYVWSNADQDPVPPEKRTWTGWSFTWYWFSDLVTAAGWSAASAVMTTGLSANDAILITFVAAMCNAIPTVLNGAIGANLHIPFPIAIRASYGYWLSYFTVITRGILALFWFGVQTAYGAECVTQMITAIWPSYAHLANHLPASARITTQGMLQYMLWTKTVLLLPTALAMVIWISVKAGNGRDFFNQGGTLTGSARAWAWVSALTSITGGFSTLAVNISDFSRFSRSPTAHLWQLPMIPFFKCIVAVFGVVSASAASKIYGEVLWNPLDIIAQWQGSSGGRAAAFFASAVWCLAQICVNVTANSISFGNDITTLAPRWFNLRRGVILCAVLGGWALCPWIIIASASALLSFMSGYACFLAPIAGIMFSDYWIVKKRRYDVPALYDPKGIYSYRIGMNLRALATTVIVVGPLLPGMAHKINSSLDIGTGLVHLFSFNWLYGFVLSITLYVGLHFAFPDRRTTIPEVVPGTAEALYGVSIDGDSEKQSVHVSPGKQSMEQSGAKEIGLVGVA
ncbi:putative permease [Pseudocercospora fuligena]|uniref:Putative permease n=1 Tax=Pseudocercospora fuligena TaxID=685502 RepID=A0A8H6VDF0_9PEZI|nr:putative permease [Pseudocercospora fuligena]